MASYRLSASYGFGAQLINVITAMGQVLSLIPAVVGVGFGGILTGISQDIGLIGAIIGGANAFSINFMTTESVIRVGDSITSTGLAATTLAVMGIETIFFNVKYESRMWVAAGITTIGAL